MTGPLPEGYNGLAAAVPALPSAWYFDPAHHARELEAIWYRDWVYLCRADALEGPRSFRSFEIGDQNILVLRDREGALRAFHNTCRHRGSILCREAEGRLPANRLVCPYHAWSYGLDGALLATSSLAQPEGFALADYPLYDVALTEWRGFLFVNLAADPKPFEETWDAGSERFDNWPLETLVVGHRHERVMACNWKLFWDNFNECLHCPNLHPELVRSVPIYGRRIMAERDDPRWAAHKDASDPALKGGLREGVETWSMDGAAQGAGFPGLSEDDRRAGYRFAMHLPSMYLVGHIDYVRSVRLRPLGPERTELVAEWLFPPETLADPDFDLANVVDFATLVMEQDAGACEMNQAGLRALPHEAGVLMPEEYDVKRFQDWVRAAL